MERSFLGVAWIATVEYHDRFARSVNFGRIGKPIKIVVVILNYDEGPVEWGFLGVAWIATTSR